MTQNCNRSLKSDKNKTKNLHAIKFDLFNIIKCCTFSKYIQHELKILQLSSLFASLHGYIIEMVNFHFAQRNEHGKLLKLQTNWTQYKSLSAWLSFKQLCNNLISLSFNGNLCVGNIIIAPPHSFISAYLFLHECFPWQDWFYILVQRDTQNFNAATMVLKITYKILSVL